MAEEQERSKRPLIDRVYTRGGDAGETSLIGGERVGKEERRIDAYGTVDELNTFVGAALVSARSLSREHAGLGELAALLRRVQHELFDLGSTLAARPAARREGAPRVGAAEIERLEAEIDRANADLPALRSFVLPGGSALSVQLHQCRAICRRAERICVGLSREEQVDADALRYLNRLSDAFFVWSRLADRRQGAEETLWEASRQL